MHIQSLSHSCAPCPPADRRRLTMAAGLLLQASAPVYFLTEKPELLA